MAAPPPDDRRPFLSEAGAFFGGIGGRLVGLARVVLSGQASPSQIVFFAVGVLGLACVAVLPVAAYQNNQMMVYVAFGGLAVDLLVAIVLMAWVMRGPPAPPVDDRDRSDVRGTAAVDQARAALAAEVERHEKTAARLRDREALVAVYGQAADAIARHFEGETARYPVILRHLTTILIEPDGTAWVEQRRTIRAVARRRQHFLIDKFTGTTGAGSFVGLQYKLKVHSPGSRRVVHLPGLELAGLYEILLAFLPAVTADDPFDFSTSFCWPRAFNDLTDPNKDCDYYGIIVRSVEPVPVVQFVFQFRRHEHIPQLTLADRGTAAGQQVDPPSEFMRPDCRTYCWEARNVEHEQKVSVWLRKG